MLRSSGGLFGLVFVLLCYEKVFKAFQRGKILRRKGLLLPLLCVKWVIIAQTKQIIRRYLIQAADGHKRIMPRRAFVLLPAANRIKGHIQFVGKRLLCVAMVFADFL